MFIRERITRNPVLCSAALPISDAFDLMKKEHISRIPVVDEGGKLIGIVYRKGCAARPAFARHDLERL